MQVPPPQQKNRRKAVFLLGGSDSVWHCRIGTCKILRGPVQQNGEQNQGREIFASDGEQKMFLANVVLPPQQVESKTPLVGVLL